MEKPYCLLVGPALFAVITSFSRLLKTMRALCSALIICWMLHGKARNRSVPYHMIFPLGLKYYENLGSHSPGSSQGQPAMPSQPWFFSKHRCRYPLSGQYSSRNFFLYFFLLCDVVRTPLLASLLAYFSLSK